MARNTTTTLAGKRLVQVLRVSRRNGRDGSAFMSPDEQRDANARFCAREGAEIVATVDETDSVSGGSVEREGLGRALWLCDEGEADGIVVAKLDRFARTVLGGLKVVSDMKDKGHLLVSATQGPLTGVGDAVLRPQTRCSSATALAEPGRGGSGDPCWQSPSRRTPGRRHIGNGVAGQQPYGYVRGADRKLVVVPEEAEVVRQMFQMRSEGKGWITITEAVNAAGARPRRADQFMHASVRGIIFNRTYLGELRSGDFVNTEAHEPIVSLALFNAANEAPLDAYSQGWVGASLLSGLARCASCGQKLRSEKAHGTKYRYYRCRIRHGWGVCPDPVNAPADALDAFVGDRFLQDFCDLDQGALVDDGALEVAQAALADAVAERDAYTLTVGDQLVARASRLATTPESRLSARLARR